jgi:hypothetical protein
MISTEAGIEIDTSDEQPEKTKVSICFSFESDSKYTAESVTQFSKHHRRAGRSQDCNSIQVGRKIEIHFGKQRAATETLFLDDLKRRRKEKGFQ